MMPYSTIVEKKFLDMNGLRYFSGKLNNYPTNDVIEAVVDGIQDALDEKQALITATGVLQGDGSGNITSAQNIALLLYDTTENWNRQTTFVPQEGTIVVYTDHGTADGSSVPGIKIGDGLAYVVDLPFVTDDREAALQSLIATHTQNTDIHVTASDKTNWNNKLNCSISGETLIFNRL